MSNMETYKTLSTPPPDALKEITYGALKGKSDINPQWRYEALTQEFGLCGYGWKFEVVDKLTQAVPATGEVMVYVLVNLYIKQGEEWSAPIPGYGGDFLLKKDKNGLHGNDEAFKMAMTDALGTAAKMIGVAADVYRGKFNGASDSKYARREPPKQPTNATLELCKEIAAAAQNAGISKHDLTEIVKWKFGKRNSLDCSITELNDLKTNYAKYFNSWLDAMSAEESQ